MSKKKPPIGIMPKKLWKEHRRMELADAICRYVYNQKKIPVEWILEQEELNEGVEDEDI